MITVGPPPSPVSSRWCDACAEGWHAGCVRLWECTCYAYGYCTTHRPFRRKIEAYGYEHAPRRRVWCFMGWRWPFARLSECYCPACRRWKAPLPWNGATGLCSACSYQDGMEALPRV